MDVWGGFIASELDVVVRGIAGIGVNVPMGLWGGFLASEAAVRVSIIAVIVAGISLLGSGLSALTSCRALALNLRQAAHQEPNLQLVLLDSWYDVDDTNYKFDIGVTVSNPSGAENAVVSTELIVKYFFENQTLSLSANPLDQTGPDLTSNQPLSAPFDIHAHRAVKGRLLFAIPTSAIRGKRVAGYTLRFTDTFGTISELTIDFVSERRAGP